MDVSLLSNGAIKAWIEGHGPPKPRFQVLGIKKIVGDSKAEKYRIQLSDGIHHQAGMLATQMNEKIYNNEVSKYCIIQAERLVVNNIQGKRIMIIINLTVLHKSSNVGGMLGNPAPLEILCENGGSVQKHPAIKRDPSPPPLTRPPLAQNQPSLAPPRSSYAPPSTSIQQTPPKSFYGGSAAPPPSSYGGGSSMVQQSPQGGVKSVVPITALNPYQNKWTIKVRVTSKPPLRNYSNSRGEGRIMSLELVDQSGEIRATAFNEDADRLFPLIEANKVYYVSRGRIRPANKQFTTCNNDYELMFGAETTVEECFDGSAELPSASFNFTSIADLESVPKDSVIDIIGVCSSFLDVGSVTTRQTNRKVSKRDITLLDKSGKSVTCTLWGSEAEGFDGSSYPVIAIKGVKVSDFNGISLSALGSSTLHYNPDIPEAHQLKGWYDHYGKEQQVTSLSSAMSAGSMHAPFLTFRQIKELNLGQQEKPEYFNCKGMTTFVRRENCVYKACSNGDCNKKVNEDGVGYFCEKCGQSSPSFKYRMIMKLNCADFADNCWLDCFNDGAAVIIGMDGQALGEKKEENEAEFDQILKEAYFKEFIFRVRAKVDTYNDEQRLRCSCVSVQPVNYATEAKRLLEQVQAMMYN